MAGAILRLDPGCPRCLPRRPGHQSSLFDDDSCGNKAWARGVGWWGWGWWCWWWWWACGVGRWGDRGGHQQFILKIMKNIKLIKNQTKSYNILQSHMMPLPRCSRAKNALRGFEAQMQKAGDFDFAPPASPGTSLDLPAKLGIGNPQGSRGARRTQPPGMREVRGAPGPR